MLVKVVAPPLSYRIIDLERDAELATAHQRDACIATFGNPARFQGAMRYLRWLRNKVEEFPDGFLMAYLEDRCVGQLELEVPYGLTTGYANLFYLRPEFRGLGFGPALHERAERYFRSWEASRVELHVSPTNAQAIRFYRRMGYHLVDDREGSGLWRMAKEL